MLAELKRLLDFRLFDLGGQGFTIATALTLVLVLLFTLQTSRWLQHGVERAFRRRKVRDHGTIAVTQRLLHYAVLLIGLAIALETAGVQLSALFAAGAVFAVAIGFAMQTIAQNFVAGVILLIERSITPGDVLTVDGMVLRVAQLGIRTTTARTRDEEDILVPNSLLVGATVKNHTLSDSLHRLRVRVGVAYESDMTAVKAALLDAGAGSPHHMEGHEPVALLLDFGDSSVVWELSIWVDDPWTAPRAASDLREGIWHLFAERDITIAFPQLDVHFDREVVNRVAA